MTRLSLACLGAGGADIGPTQRGSGSKRKQLIDGTGLPLAVTVHGDRPPEVTLIKLLLDRHGTRRSGP